MSRIITSENLLIPNQKVSGELADFLQQDEQEILQTIEIELDQLICEPSEMVIKKILAYASLF